MQRLRKIVLFLIGTTTFESILLNARLINLEYIGYPQVLLTAGDVFLIILF
jgi:hypothetical protein